MEFMSANRVSLSVEVIGENMYNRSDDANQAGVNAKQLWEYHVAVWLYYYSPWINLMISTVGNGAAFITLIRMRPFSSLSLIVSYLAVMDTLCVTFNVTHSLLTIRKVAFGDIGCRLMAFLLNYTTYLANWTIVLMTVERFVAVTFPLKISQSFTIRKSVLYLAAMAVVFFLPPCPALWTYTELDRGNQTKICGERPGFEELSLFLTWLDFILVSLLPCSLLIFLNAAIIRCLYKAAKLRREVLNSASSTDRTNRTSDRRPRFPHAHLSLMLVAVSIAFIILQLPITIYYIINRYRDHPQDSTGKVRRFLVANIMHSLNELNHSFNFIFYFLSGRKFRQRFLEVFYCTKMFQMVRNRNRNNAEGSIYDHVNSCETKMINVKDDERNE